MIDYPTIAIDGLPEDVLSWLESEAKRLDTSVEALVKQQLTELSRRQAKIIPLRPEDTVYRGE
jgi:hypothetical protein